MKNHSENRILYNISYAVIKGRFILFALFAAALVFCAFSFSRVRINTDLTSLLPADSETRKGIAVMSEEFTALASAQVMVEDVTVEKALELCDDIRSVPHVISVLFDDSDAHYKDGSALFTIGFDGVENDVEVVGAMEQINGKLSSYKTYTSTAVGFDYLGQLAGEMGFVIGLAAIVILAVLLFTSKSYFEILIFAVVFITAAALNMGTNYWFGEISSITNSVAIILQLALAIDYAIIFAHRYYDELDSGSEIRVSLVHALSKSIVEISSSSLTTVSGLVALMLMQFRLGYDLGIVLAKGIVFSMLTVFLLMPGLFMVSARLLEKTRHRSFVPEMHKWGAVLTKKVPFFLLIFAVVLPASIYFSSRTEYAFSDSSVTEIIHSDRRDAMRKIRSAFAPNTSVAMILPKGDYEHERAIIEETKNIPGVSSVLGLAGIGIGFDTGKYLTDLIGTEDFAELVNADKALVERLFYAHGLENGNFKVLRGTDGYEVPLVDIVLYLFEKIDSGVVSLDQAQTALLDEIRPSLETAAKQLRGTDHSRIVFTSSLLPEGEESVELVEKLRACALKYYSPDDVLVIGEITSARDLKESYKSDSVLISWLTIAFVFLILLITFKSPVAAAVLVFVIQGSIWINFSILYLTGSVPFFVTNMIVSAIQMGATIDYAIVIMNRYRALRAKNDKRTAASAAVNESFPTVITSGAIMTFAGLLIAFRVSDVYVGHIGLAVGRGALISVVIVLTVLPQLLVLLDKAIIKTTVRFGGTDGKDGEE